MLIDLIESGVIAVVDELQIEWHNWISRCREIQVRERNVTREGMHQRLLESGLRYGYATFDADVWRVMNNECGDGGGNGDQYQCTWQDVPKYRLQREWPRPWVDLHYFRKGNLRSAWDVGVYGELE